MGEAAQRDGCRPPPAKDGLKVLWFATGKDDFLLSARRSTVELLKKLGTQTGVQGDGRRAHLDQLAAVPERVRPAALPLIGRPACQRCARGRHVQRYR